MTQQDLNNSISKVIPGLEPQASIKQQEHTAQSTPADRSPGEKAASDSAAGRVPYLALDIILGQPYVNATVAQQASSSLPGQSLCPTNCC